MKLIVSLSVCVFLTLSFTAFAGQDYVCDNNGLKRIVSIVYQNEEAPVPCEVRYDKGQGVETLWTAQAEVGYCEARANEFIEKQESWGWSCEEFEPPVVDSVVEELHSSLY